MSDKPDPSDLAVMTFELLKRSQVQITDVQADMRNLKVRMSAVETGIGHLNSRMDRFDERMVRIERRLELADTTAG